MNLEDAVSTSRLFRLLGNPLRISLLNALSEGDATLQELSDTMERKKPCLCMNLGELCRAGLVEKQGVGSSTTYCLKAGEVLEVISYCCSLCKSLQAGLN